MNSEEPTAPMKKMTLPFWVILSVGACFGIWWAVTRALLGPLGAIPAIAFGYMAFVIALGFWLQWLIRDDASRFKRLRLYMVLGSAVLSHVIILSKHNHHDSQHLAVFYLVSFLCLIVPWMVPNLGKYLAFLSVIGFLLIPIIIGFYILFGLIPATVCCYCLTLGLALTGGAVAGWLQEIGKWAGAHWGQSRLLRPGIKRASTRDAI